MDRSFIELDCGGSMPSKTSISANLVKIFEEETTHRWPEHAFSHAGACRVRLSVERKTLMMASNSWEFGYDIQSLPAPTCRSMNLANQEVSSKKADGRCCAVVKRTERKATTPVSLIGELGGKFTDTLSVSMRVVVLSSCKMNLCFYALTLFKRHFWQKKKVSFKYRKKGLLKDNRLLKSFP